jgi:acid stress-induced BolA-like protein IbaG/YrbA
MMHSEQIKKIIRAGLACEHLDIEGDGDHFEAVVVSAEFVGKSRVQRQQRVNALLRDCFDSGKLHALSMKTLTPEEWSAARG